MTGLADAEPTQHQNITIEGNDEFTLENGVSSGTGSPADPYIIEDLIIMGSTSRGIRIRHTDSHIVIRNVLFLRDNGLYIGVSLKNVTNCIVYNCQFENLTYGLDPSPSVPLKYLH